MGVAQPGAAIVQIATTVAGDWRRRQAPRLEMKTATGRAAGHARLAPTNRAAQGQDALLSELASASAAAFAGRPTMTTSRSSAPQSSLEQATFQRASPAGVERVAPAVSAGG